MSAHDNDNDELIDYEDGNEAEVPMVPSATNGASTTAAATAAAGDKEKKGYVGVHSTGFRYVQ